MWRFEAIDGSEGWGDDPDAAVIDNFGEASEVEFTTDEVTADEKDIEVRALDDDFLLGWCTWVEDEDDS